MGKKRKKRRTSSLDGLPQQMVFKFPNSNNKKNKKESKNNNHNNGYKKNQSIMTIYLNKWYLNFQTVITRNKRI